MSVRGITRLIVAVTLATVLTISLTSADAEESPSESASEGTTIHVSPGGSDEGTGSADAPLRTINAALSLADGGDTIEVASGEYPPVRWISAFQSPVTVRGTGLTRPVISVPPEANEEAMALWGAGNLVIEGLEVRGGVVRITDHPVLKSAQPAEHITLRNDEFVGVDGLGSGLNIRNGSKDVVLEGSYIHDLTSGITCGNYRVISGEDTGAPLVDGVTIRNNRLERFKQDAMQFADWEHVVIDHNIMQHATHDPEPAPQYHNDLIQFTGYSQHVRITNNYLADSAQEIFIQPKFGPIDDILVENNAILGARAYAVQSQAVTGLRFLYNTLWDSQYGLTIRHGPSEEPAATDGVVIGNIINRLGYPAGTREEYNLIGELTRPEGYGPHDLLAVDPSFQGAGNYSLRSTSPPAHAGSPELFPRFDLLGMERVSPPSMGAYEVGLDEAGNEEPPVAAEEPGTTEEQPTGEEEPPLSSEIKSQKRGPPDASSGPRPHEKADGETHHAGSGHDLRIALRLSGHRWFVVSRSIPVPDICLRDCRIRVTGVARILGVSRLRRRLRPAHTKLSILKRRGLKLSPKGGHALNRKQFGRRSRVSARLLLRYIAAPSQRAVRQVYVKFDRAAGLISSSRIAGFPPIGTSQVDSG